MTKTTKEVGNKENRGEKHTASHARAPESSGTKGENVGDRSGQGKGADRDTLDNGSMSEEDRDTREGDEEALSEVDEAVEPESPEERIENLTRENEELQDRFLRLKADFENFKKRVAKEKANLIQYGNETLLGDLLPVIDNMERMLVHGLQEGRWEDFRKGIELVLGDIHKTLSRYGVRAIQSVGEPFDPKLHEAMQQVETDDSLPDTVMEEFQRGYMFKDRLLRPSRVAVSASKGNGNGEEGPQGDGKQD